MTDELQLLREMFSEDCELDQKGWARILRDVEVEIEASSTIHGAKRASLLRTRHRRLAASAAIASVAAISMVLALILLPSASRRSSGQSLTREQRPGTWHVDAGTTNPLNVTCPTTSVCYLEGETDQGRPLNYVSFDGGATWNSLRLPKVLAGGAIFACITSQSCMIVGGRGDSEQLIYTTHNAGVSWKLAATINTDQLEFSQITCFTVSTCFGFGSIFGTHTQALRIAFARTDDGGRHWSTKVLDWPKTSGIPTSLYAQPDISFTCSDEDFCIGLGDVLTEPHVLGGRAITLEWRTVNGGKTWTGTTLSQSGPMSGHSSNGVQIQQNNPHSLSCWSASDCLAVGALAGDPPRFEVTMQPYVDALLRTTNGGKTWVQIAQPERVSISSVSCFAGGHCWAAGIYWPTSESNRGAVFLSSNGGRSWSVPTFLPPSTQANSIDCPSATTCYVAAWSSRGQGDLLFTNSGG